MSELSVSLRIYCGSDSEGFSHEPAVSLGTAPPGYKPSAPTLVNENRSWVIVHAQRYTMYALCVKPMRTMNGDDGIVLINIFLPAHQRFAREASPVHILTELFNTFTATGTHNGILPDSPIESEPFANVLLRYPLEDRVVTLPVMQGTKTASYCAASEMQLNAIMRHSRYQALTGVGQLELGMHCKSTIDLMPRSVTTPGAKTVVNPKAAPKISNNAPIAPQPIVKPKSESHKFIRFAAIILGVVIAIPVVMLVLRSMSDSPAEDSNKPISEQTNDANITNPASDQAENISIASTDSYENTDKYDKSTTKSNQLKEHDQGCDTPSPKLKKQVAATNKKVSWSSRFEDMETECPIQLRPGVRIMSISVSPKNVKFIIEHEVYNKERPKEGGPKEGPYQKKLKMEADKFYAKYCSDLPTNISCNIIFIDEFGKKLYKINM